MPKNAYIIHLFDDKIKQYLWLTVGCARSIRAFDNSNDVVVQVLSGKVSSEAISVLEDEGVKIVEEEPIVCDRRMHNRLELSKTRMWKRVEYDKVLSLDADCLAKTDLSFIFKDFDEFTCFKGRSSPICCCSFLIKPSISTYSDLIDIISESDFSREDGWRKFGPIPHWKKNNEESNWSFHGAEATQGLYYYYFGLMKKTLNRNWRPRIIHFGRGDYKFGYNDIFTEYEKMGFDDLKRYFKNDCFRQQKWFV